jgi:ABC-type multidrug transport system fused ATPase/permease subunit
MATASDPVAHGAPGSRRGYLERSGQPVTLRLLLDRPWSMEKAPRSLPSTLYRFVFSFAPGHQTSVCLLSVAVAGIGFVPLELQRRIVNTAIEGENLTLLFWLAGFYGVYMVSNAALKVAANSWRDWIGQSAVYQLRRHLLRRRQDAVSGSEETGNGRAVAVIDKETDLVGLFVGTALSEPITNIGIIASMLIYMLIVEPLVALVSLAFLIPQIVLVPVFQGRLNLLLARRISMLRTLGDDIAGSEREGDPDDWRRDADLTDAIPGALPAASMLPARRGRKAGGETPMSDDLLIAIFRNRMLFLVIKYLMKAAINLLSHMAVLSVLAVGGYMVIAGQTSLGVVVAFLSGFERLGEPIRDMVLFYREMEQSRVEYDLIRDWPERKPNAEVM